MADENTIDPEHEALLAEWRKKATPAHIAQFVTRDLPVDSEAKWLPFKHHLYMNEVLVEAATDSARSFINLSVSVRMGKSEIVSRYLPFWYLGMFPDRDVVIISNSATNAEKWGLATLNLMRQYGPELFGLTVDPSNSGKSEWGLKGRKGTLRAVGIGTQIEGRGIHLGVLDDVMGFEQARSPTERQNIWEWYTGQYRTRLMQGSTTVLCMSRWHLQDLAGMIEAHAEENPGGDPWVTIKLPAIAEAPRDADSATWRNPIDQKAGEPLWPERWSLADLTQLRNSMTNITWESRYQQNPTAAEGGMFKVDKWMSVPHVDESTLRTIRMWDLAATEGAGDWTVGVKMGLDHQNRVYIIDVQRFRKDAAGVKKQVLATAQLDGRNTPIGIEQERAGAGKAQLSDMKRLLFGYTVIPIKPDGKKAERAAPFASQQQDSNVYIVGNPAWKADYIEEHRVFDRGRWDDQVDASSAAFNELAQTAPSQIITPEHYGAVPIDRMMTMGFGGASQEFNIPVG